VIKLKTREKILIVEDDILQAKSLSNHLSSFGYDVLPHADSVDKVMQCLEKMKPDLILMDISLKGRMDGIEGTNQIRSRFDIPIVFVTAYSSENLIKRAKETEPYGYIIKPFSKSDVKTAVELALYKHEIDRKLKVSEEKYRDLVDNSGIGILIDNETGGFNYFNNRFATIFGYSKAEMKGQRIDSLVHPDDVGWVMKRHADRISGKRRRSKYEFRGIQKDGSTIYIEVIANTIKENGKITGTRSFIADITERKQADMALKESLKEWSSTFNSMNDSICLLDKDSTILKCNRKTSDMLHKPMKAILGKKCWEVVHGTTKPIENCALIRMKKSKKRESVEVNLGNRILNVFVDPVFDDNNKIVKVVHIIEDITERKRAEEKLKKSEHSLKATQALAHMSGWEYNLKTQAVVWSDEMYCIFGLDPEDGPPSWPAGHEKLIHPDDWKWASKIIEESVKEGKNYEFDDRFFRPDGSIGWLHVIGEIQLGKDGTPEKIIGTVHDITQRKRMERQLRDSEIKLKIRNRISEIFLTIPDENMYKELLDVILEAMESEFGTFGYFSEDGSFVTPAITRKIFWEKCNVPEKEIIFKRGQFSGIWEKAIKEKRTHYDNEGPFNTPKGHIPIKNTMVTPVYFQNKLISAIHVANKSTDYDEKDKSLFEMIANHIAPVLNARLQRDREELSRKKAEWRLKERMKELTCLSNLRQDMLAHLNIDTFFGRIVKHLLPAMQFPEITVPVVEFDGKRFTTEKFTEGISHTIRSNIKVEGEDRGYVSIQYTEEKPFIIPEEQNLIDAIASEMGFWLERKFADQKIEQSKIRYQKLFNRVLTPIFLLNPETQIIEEVNIAGMRIAGYTSEDLIGSPFKKVMPEYRQKIKKLLKVIEEEEEEEEEELRLTNKIICTKKGEKRIVDAVLSYYVYSDKPLIQIIMTDITERKRTEEALQESEERFSLFMDYFPACAFIKDQETRTLFVNKYMDDMFGAKEWLGKTVFELFPSDVAEKMMADDRITLDSGYRTSVEELPDKNDVVHIYETYKFRLDRHNKPPLLGGIALGITERKKAEEALKESEEKLKLSMKSAGEGMWEWDFTTDEAYFDDVCLQILGYKPGEIQKKVEWWWNQCHPDDVAPTKKAVKDYIEGRTKNYSVEFRLRSKCGKYIWVSSNGAVVRKDEDDKPLYMIGIHQDITERKRVEEAIQKEHTFTNAILDTAGALMVVYDSEGRIIRFNKACMRTTGYSFLEMKKKHVWDKLVIPEELERVQSDFKTMSAGVMVKKSENHWLTKDGDLRLISWSNTVLLDEEDTVEFIIAIGIDITERRKYETALRKSEDQYRVLIESSEDPICLMDQELNYLVANEKLLSRLGKSMDEVVGHGYREFHTTGKTKEFSKQLNEVVKTGRPVFYEHRSEKDGHYFLRTLSPVIDPRTGKIMAVTVISKDITEHKKEEQQLKAYQYQLRNLASELTLAEEKERRRIASELHDSIAQELVVWQMKLEEIQDSASTKEIAESLGEIVKGIEKTTQVTRTLIFEISPTILYELGLEAALEWLAEIFQQEHGITMHVNYDSRQKSLSEDVEVFLFKAVRELLINVIKHAQAERVQISIVRSTADMIISVQDDGIGIKVSPEDFQRIGMTGFGLFNIRERLHQIGGRMEIDSRSKQGTRVNLMAPILHNESMEKE